MTDKLTDLSCASFAEALSSTSPVPGGGGAAALAGALAASLCAMAANFTSGREKYAAFQTEVENIISSCNSLRIQLIDLAEEDAESFKPLACAYKLPSDDPQRVSAIEEAAEGACSPPLRMLECCCRVTELLESMLKIDNRMLISDVGCGAALCAAAMECAAMNVFVNTASLQDRAYTANINSRVNEQLDKYLPRAAAIKESVYKIIT